MADFVGGRAADYQMSAFLMAVFLRGMTAAETAALTLAMVRSGRTLDLSRIPGRKVDKHSTGGVGDKVSLVLAPLVASLGVPVPMVSGRGLGHTGGTLDKLESIPGFSTRLAPEDFVEQVARLGLAFGRQSPEIAPADMRMYALRDVTGTVESIPLIVASILSKKVAEGIDALVLDVKFGDGAFLPEIARARELAAALTGAAEAAGIESVALLTSMEEPLGRAVGNACEVEESIEALRGGGPPDLREVTLALAVEMLLLARAAAGRDDARRKAEEALASGRALGKFREAIAAQGGDPRVVEDPAGLPRPVEERELLADREGTVTRIAARAVGEAVVAWGGGRARAEDEIDPSVSVRLLRKVGDPVKRGEPLARIGLGRAGEAGCSIASAASWFEIGDAPPARRPLVLERRGPGVR